MVTAWLNVLKKFPYVSVFFKKKSILEVRSSISSNTQSKGFSESTLWVDISILSQHDAGSGIQRVVRSLLTEFHGLILPGWRIQPVAAKAHTTYRTTPWENFLRKEGEGEKVIPKNGDIFLCLDLSVHIIPRRQSEILRWKRRGVKIVFVVYDLLPLQHPEWFSAKLVNAFRKWIKSVSILADCVFCISKPVEHDFRNYMFDRFGISLGELPTHILTMGVDSAIRRLRLSEYDKLSDFSLLFDDRGIVLMVGTIEPRKGYSDVIDAFEYLWSRNNRNVLAIVGKPGWMTEGLQRKILGNMYLNKNLFWFDRADDAVLNALYHKCTGVILASHAEGFGLPLLEAIAHKKSVLARDIPVFRQFDDPLVSHFPVNCDFRELASCIDSWLISVSLNKSDSFCTQSYLPSWRDSLQNLLEQLLPSKSFALGRIVGKSS